MKKLFAAAMLVLIMVLCLPSYAQQVRPVTVTLNGMPVDCVSYGQQATIVDGRTLVPLRAIFEALGATVEWDHGTKTITSDLNGITINLSIGEKTLYKNGKPVELDVPAAIMNGRTMVPVRAISEAFGVYVRWDRFSRNVILIYSGYARGKLENETYNSEWLNMKFSLPEGYEFADSEYIKEMMGLSGDVTFDSIASDFAVSMYEFSCFDKDGRNTSLVIEKNTYSMTESVYVKQSLDAYRLMGIEYELCDVYTSDISGRKFNNYIVKLNVDGTERILAIAVAQKKDLFVSIVSLYNSSEEYGKIISCFEKLSEEYADRDEKTYTLDEVLSAVLEDSEKTELDKEILVSSLGVDISASEVKAFVTWNVMQGIEESLINKKVKQDIQEYIMLRDAINKYNAVYTQSNLDKVLEMCHLFKVYYENDPALIYYDTGNSSSYNYVSMWTVKNSAEKIIEARREDKAFMDELCSRTCTKLKENGYVAAKHILICKDENKTDAEVLAEAKTVLEKVKANPEHFEMYMKVYGEDPGMENFSGGYVFTKGEMVAEFEQAVYNMKVGEISDIVETDHGFHIILKTDIVAENLMATSAVTSDEYLSICKEIIFENAQKERITYAVGFNQRISDFVADANSILKDK